MLKATDVTICFENDARQFTAVEKFSLQIGEGEIVGLVGASGCGKTVFASALLGMVEYPGRITSGNIRFLRKDGGESDLTALTEPEWRSIRGREISMIFQDAQQSFHPSRTIQSQFIEAIRIHDKSKTKTECISIAKEMFDSVLLADAQQVLASYAFQLSGGMCQRVAAAMALVHRPRLLIADEPTTALDIVSQRQLVGLIDKLRADFGTAVLFISHDLQLVKDLADRIVYM